MKITLSSVQNFPVLRQLAVCLLAGFMLSCGSSAKETDTTKQPKQARENNLLASARYDTARMENTHNELSLTGKVTFNQDQVVKVFPLVGGHIEDLKAELGDYVQKGQTLAVIRSGDLADLEQEAVSARGQLSLAQKNLQINEDLLKAGFSSEREVLTSREQLAAAKGELNRVGERRRIVGGSGSVYYVKAPMSGFVVEKSAAEGMELRSDDPENLFTISNLDRVWVLANVYESDLSNIKEGDQASITTISYPDKVFTGRIDKIFNVLDPDSKTLKVRVTLNNPDFRLKPEMFANVNVIYAGRDERVMIPASSVVFDKNRNFVVAVNDKNRPVVREVNIYKTIGPKTYVTSGITPGDRIITANNLLIYNALSN